MASFVQSSFPEITIKRLHSANNFKNVLILSANTNTNLINYNFSRSVNQVSGEFSLTIKDDKDGKYIDLIQPLDLVYISESQGNGIDFIGVVIKKSFSANANGLQRQINISGKSFSYLYEYLTIAEDVTAMAITSSSLNSATANLKLKTALVKKSDETETVYEPISIIDAANGIYEVFCNVANEAAKSVTNTDIIQLIDSVCKSDKFITFQNELKFKYPITNNMFGGNSTVSYINYLRNLLPQNLYEIYEEINNGFPQIMIREVPFSKTDWGYLNIFRSNVIKPEILINYTVTNSIEEVYTAFFSYLQGSAFSPEWYSRKNAAENGSSTNAVNEEKRKKYGFKLLTTNFIGYTNSDIKLDEVFSKMNTDMSNWYGNLDEMYDATITVINETSKKVSEKTRIGERIKFLGGEFYVTGEEHSWNYGQSPRITYHCERGGIYDPSKEWGKGFFKKIPNITKALSEYDSIRKEGVY